jgi:hypothetical protein
VNKLLCCLLALMKKERWFAPGEQLCFIPLGAVEIPLVGAELQLVALFPPSAGITMLPCAESARWWCGGYGTSPSCITLPTLCCDDRTHTLGTVVHLFVCLSMLAVYSMNTTVSNIRRAGRPSQFCHLFTVTKVSQ